MGVIGKLIGGPAAVSALGDAAKGMAEVFVPSATRRMELSAEAQMAALNQFGDEFGNPSVGWFDRLVNGLNRLPRPFLAFGTIGLFVYAMVDPVQFARRMVGLNAVPEPLWWLLGAVVAFYFGAREASYFRARAVRMPSGLAQGPASGDANPALEDWRGRS
ncbi:MAG: holin family protein [Pseudomonadota bacterium]